jgi:hypothetical protein
MAEEASRKMGGGETPRVRGYQGRSSSIPKDAIARHSQLPTAQSEGADQANARRFDDI